MPRRSPEHPLSPPRRRGVPALLVVALAAVLGTAPPLAAQESPEPFRIGLMAVAGVRATDLVESSAFLPGGGLLLRLAPRFAVGGGGWATPNAVPAGGPGFEVSFGYGGLLLDFVADPEARSSPGARLLVGGGNVLVRDEIVGAELDSDNVFVVEPEASLGIELVRGLRAVASAGWRLALGADVLPAAGVDGLGGWSAALVIAVGPF